MIMTVREGVPGPLAGGARFDRPRRWDDLAARADEPGAQAEIRRGIRAGMIRVVPAPGGGIRLLRSAPGAAGSS
jgi:hypothetical protein